MRNGLEKLLLLETLRLSIRLLQCLRRAASRLIESPAREGAMYGATLAEVGPWIGAFEERLHAMIDLLEDLVRR